MMKGPMGLAIVKERKLISTFLFPPFYYISSRSISVKYIQGQTSITS